MKPQWFRQTILSTPQGADVRRILSELSLNTVCEEARCPNRNSCFSCGNATFMILGDTCTRNCRFCAVKTGNPPPSDPSEPKRIASASKRMNLSYVVITSVTRDDLEDGGAGHFAETIRAIKKSNPEQRTEVLTPDFKGVKSCLDIVISAKPDVFNHNIETISPLYSLVRPQADYNQSLSVLSYVANNSDIPVKSGFMVGLGEKDDDVFSLLSDLYSSGVSLVTIGQYLAPGGNHYPVDRYVSPEQFKAYEDFAIDLGIKCIFSGPLVRSSYKADLMFRQFFEVNNRINAPKHS